MAQQGSPGAAPAQPQQSPPPRGIDLTGLVLMGMPGCGGCAQAAQWFDSHSVTYRKYDVSTSPGTIAWLQTATGQRTVPQFFYNGKHLQGGFAQARHFVETGQLQQPRVTQVR